MVYEDKSLEEKFMDVIRKGTIDFKLNEGILSEDDSFDIITLATMFHIDLLRTAEIVVYLKRIFKDYKGSAADILRDIYHNIFDYEKYFAAYILGKNFKSQFSKMIEEDPEGFMKFMGDIASILDVSNLINIAEYIDSLIRQERPGALPAYGIKKIMNSDFEDNDKVFMVFLYAIM